MWKVSLLINIALLFCFQVIAQKQASSSYLNSIKSEFVKEWPNNRTVNLVFHGHSVPAGYFKTPVVNTLNAYPNLVLKRIKAKYPKAIVNIINTAIGGENSKSGAKRFNKEVLSHRPDVLFIDYALNDRRIGLEVAQKSWNKMIKKALKKGIKVILFTPSPDQRVDILQDDSILLKHSAQIKNLAVQNQIGLVESYDLFRKKVVSGKALVDFMAQSNHPNEKGHALIADEIFKFFD